MKTEKILNIVEREMRAYAARWRGNWSDFDGRQLRDQVDRLFSWAERAKDLEETDYTDGTEFLKAEQESW